ncbi:TetR/AcrR family transcriptional regulator [Williamsia sp. CHRR-6]|uniref:TetR/AcrR family transcriptional regulator n=1 Tax=Williamsia sp. CHRR-6 TaxID=2835871 RepID=UPI001BDABB0C|nr:TetR/AcrR family transcriptional regulator [Williamsia sp. CHRR-6]MBT0568273.1 TetR/AcrR family transcriptional regulator [Williamsia sp. CHRR-6]
MIAASPVAAGTTVAQRLIDALATTIADKGLTDSTVADVVRIARMSRRAFYEHFTDKNDCYRALLQDRTERQIEAIRAAVDLEAPWRDQVRHGIAAWLAQAQADPTFTLSWIRDAPGLGSRAREVSRTATDAFAALVVAVSHNEKFREAGMGPLPENAALILVGGLRELIATQVERGLSPATLADDAVAVACAVLTAYPSA